MNTVNLQLSFNVIIIVNKLVLVVDVIGWHVFNRFIHAFGDELALDIELATVLFSWLVVFVEEGKLFLLADNPLCMVLWLVDVLQLEHYFSYLIVFESIMVPYHAFQVRIDRAVFIVLYV